MYFSPGSIPGDISGEPILAGLHEVLEPGVIGAGANAFPAAEVPDGGVAAKAFENNADLLLGGELATGDAFDVPDKLLCFLGSGFSLSDSVSYSLGHYPAPFQSLLYCFRRAGASSMVSITLCLLTVPFSLTIYCAKRSLNFSVFHHSESGLYSQT